MGIGFLELVVIAVVALVLLGPQRLPGVLSQLGKFYVQLRRTSAEFRGAVDQVVRQAESEVRLDEIRRLTAIAEENDRKTAAEEAAKKDHPALPHSETSDISVNQPSSEPIGESSTLNQRPLGRNPMAIAAFDEGTVDHPSHPQIDSQMGLQEPLTAVNTPKITEATSKSVHSDKQNSLDSIGKHS
ncbi:MAG: Sec-independent protein translocase protein TatB [Proteobacteria bacterium]|nr:Sec-independent protein translocase protein TatB [Pseudomonadota bacterium]